MSGQTAIAWSEAPRGNTLDERFAAFVRQRPDIVRLPVGLARELKEAGEKRIGMKMLFEVARWTHLIRRGAGKREAWLLNNSFSSRMARLIENNYRDLAGMFETRALSEERKQ